MRHKTALITATAVVLALGATTASAAGTGAGPASGAAGKKPAQCAPAKPSGKLENALRDVKIALGSTGGKLTDKVVAIFAKDMGMSTAQARKTLERILGEAGPVPAKPGAPGGRDGKVGKADGKQGKGGKEGKSGKDDKGGPATVFTAAQLAKALGVSQAGAQAALDALQKTATGPKGSVDENSPAFAAVAARLGVTPQQLTKAIVQLKTAAGKPGEGKPTCKPGSGKPDPGKPDKPGKGADDAGKTLIPR
ncbi:hypothetical protein OG900_29630 [Streptomyces sp. NBC_00433]